MNVTVQKVKVILKLFRNGICYSKRGFRGLYHHVNVRSNTTFWEVKKSTRYQEPHSTYLNIKLSTDLTGTGPSINTSIIF